MYRQSFQSSFEVKKGEVFRLVLVQIELSICRLFFTQFSVILRKKDDTYFSDFFLVTPLSMGYSSNKVYGEGLPSFFLLFVMSRASDNIKL